MLIEGKSYNTLIREAAQKNAPYNDESKSCIHRTLQHLLDSDTSVDRPGMLLGMVQGGKTKTFLGVIALGLDNGFDLFVVLTKGTKALTTQTTERLKQAFDTIIEDDDLRVFDVMALPKLTPYEQRRPLVIVAKKQKDNLIKLRKTLCEDYPTLSRRRAVIIDDEADFASIGFRRTSSLSERARSPTSSAIIATEKAACTVILPVSEACCALSASPVASIGAFCSVTALWYARLAGSGRG